MYPKRNDKTVDLVAAAAHQAKIFFHAVHQSLNVGYQGQILDGVTRERMRCDIRDMIGKWRAARHIDNAYFTSWHDNHLLLAITGLCPSVSTLDLTFGYVNRATREALASDLLKQLGESAILHFDWVTHINDSMRSAYGPIAEYDQS